MTPTRLTLTRPDDWHLHLRDGAALAAVLPAGMAFEPLMTLYLTDHTAPEEIVRASQSGIVYGVGEVFFVGATTNSAFGVTDFARCEAVFAAMQETGLPRNRDTVTLVKQAWTVSPELDLGGETLVPLRADVTVAWRLAE